MSKQLFFPRKCIFRLLVFRFKPISKTYALVINTHTVYDPTTLQMILRHLFDLDSALVFDISASFRSFCMHWPCTKTGLPLRSPNLYAPIVCVYRILYINCASGHCVDNKIILAQSASTFDSPLTILAA